MIQIDSNKINSNITMLNKNSEAIIEAIIEAIDDPKGKDFVDGLLKTLVKVARAEFALEISPMVDRIEELNNRMKEKEEEWKDIKQSSFHMG